LGELRKDPVNGRWVIVTTDNPMKPSDFERIEDDFRGGPCPFCYGNENLTPPEIEVMRNENTKHNDSGWQVRAVANKFPALKIEGTLEQRDNGIYDILNGVGAHEVIIETPYHDKDFTDLTFKEVSKVLDMYCRRFNDLRKDERLKYILIFKNYGTSAGATLQHPHTQLIALPMIPKNVLEELNGANMYFGIHERCVFCDIIKQELKEGVRILSENNSFVSFCPFVSRFSFEVRVMPKKHLNNFSEIDDKQKQELATIMIETLKKLKVAIGKHSYNFIIHSKPLDKKNYDYYHWYIEIMPRLTRVAGFEWGTGFYVLRTPPEQAIKYLKKTKIN